jgi:hypothetical protein
MAPGILLDFPARIKDHVSLGARRSLAVVRSQAEPGNECNKSSPSP